MTAEAIKLRNECDDLCRQLVRRRVMCERCRQARGTDTAHLIRRTYMRTRCELDNLALLCRPCHIDVDQSPEMLESFAVDRLGEQRWHELLAGKRDVEPVGEQFWLIRRDYLRAIL